MAFPPGPCTSPQLYPCHRLFDQDGHQDSSSASLLSRSSSLWVLVILEVPRLSIWDNWRDERGFYLSIYLSIWLLSVFINSSINSLLEFFFYLIKFTLNFSILRFLPLYFLPCFSLLYNLSLSLSLSLSHSLSR